MYLRTYNVVTVSVWPREVLLTCCVVLLCCLVVLRVSWIAEAYITVGIYCKVLRNCVVEGIV